MKVVNTSDVPRNLLLRLSGLKKGETLKEARCLTLSSSDPDADNTLENPSAVVPQESSLPATGDKLETEIEACTFRVYRLIF